MQEPAAPEIVDGGIAASGLLAHTLISRFVDHLPYYRQETINARSRVHTPRSTLAAGAGQSGAALGPLYDAHKRFVLGCRVLHADETPVALLDPCAGKTRRAYVWAYARSWHDATPGEGGQVAMTAWPAEDEEASLEAHQRRQVNGGWSFVPRRLRRAPGDEARCGRHARADKPRSHGMALQGPIRCGDERWP